MPKGNVTKARIQKPTALRKLHGDRRDRINQDEPALEPIALYPKPTLKLNKFAKEVYDRIMPLLITTRVMATTDVEGFSMYCYEIGMYKHCREKIDKEGLTIIAGKNDYEMPHPLTSVANKHYKNAYDMAVQYGLTPSARTRITAMPEGKKEGISKYKKETKTG